MKIVSVILEDNKTILKTDTGTDIILELKSYFRIPQGAMKIDFENEEKLKQFCIENQTVNY